MGENILQKASAKWQQEYVEEYFRYLPKDVRDAVVVQIKEHQEEAELEAMKNSVERLKRRDGEAKEDIEFLKAKREQMEEWAWKSEWSNRTHRRAIYAWLAVLTGIVTAGAVWTVFLR